MEGSVTYLLVSSKARLVSLRLGRMEVEENSSETPMVVENKGDWSGRWSHVQRLLLRSGPLAHQDFEPGPQVLEFMLDTAKILVIGAGGLGCELLKDLVSI